MINIFSYELLEYTKDYLFNVCESSEVYNGDGTFNRLQIEDYDYDGLNIKVAQNKAKENIKKQKGIPYKNIMTSNVILVDYKTQGEYLYSKYTRSRKNEIKYVKCILSNYFKELFLNAYKKEFVNKKKPKHVIDAKYGFYKYSVNFSIVDKLKETFYTCIILVRNDSNGKKYLYDILDIKKTSINFHVSRSSKEHDKVCAPAN